MQSMSPTPADIYTIVLTNTVIQQSASTKEWPRSGNHRRPYQQLFRFKEVQRKIGLSDFRNVIHNEKAMLEHTIRLHKRKNYLCKFVTFFLHILRFIASHGIH